MPRQRKRRRSPASVAASASAHGHVHGGTAEGSLLVLGLHVGTGLSHGFDDPVERDEVGAVAGERRSCGDDRLGGPDDVAFDAGNLNLSADRITGEAGPVSSIRPEQLATYGFV
jgi:hypothetical protein